MSFPYILRKGGVLVIILILLFMLLVLFDIARHEWRQKDTLTLVDLSAGARLLSHPEEEAEAARLRKIAMLHYATDEAEHTGGPVYGVFGYRIVAVEYEIPLSSLGKRLVGSTDPGKLLELSEIRELGKNIKYDHFHIGISQHTHDSSHEHAASKKDTKEEQLIIHFMLISHEFEESAGLYCG